MLTNNDFDNKSRMVATDQVTVYLVFILLLIFQHVCLVGACRIS